MPQLILYACPVGPLAQQIEAYFRVSQQRCGSNAAHAYRPHCTLTGFFEDEERAIAQHVTALECLLLKYQKHIPKPPISLKRLTFRPDWHGIELEANGLKRLVSEFAAQAQFPWKASPSPTHRSPIRLKDWLHLSLAYEFCSAHEAMLKRSACDLIDLSASVSWNLNLYQRSADNVWQCHSSQPLG